MKTIYHVAICENVEFKTANELAGPLNGIYSSPIGAGKRRITNGGFAFESKSDAQCFERMMWLNRTDVSELSIRVASGLKLYLCSMFRDSVSFVGIESIVNEEVTGNATVRIATSTGEMFWNVTVESVNGIELKIKERI